MAMNKELLRVAVEARECLTRTADATFVSFMRNGHVDEKVIAYVVIKDHWYYGLGYAVFDGAWHVATFSDDVLDVFKVGLAGAQETASASAQTPQDTAVGQAS